MLVRWQTQALILLGAGGLLAFGLFCTPERLAAVDLMDEALASPDMNVRIGAQIEIAATRGAALILGAGLLLLVPFWPRVAALQSYRTWRSANIAPVAGRLAFRNAVLTPHLLIPLVGIAVVLLWIGFADRLASAELRQLVAREDGVIESLTAAGLLLAGVLALRLAARIGRGRPGFRMQVVLGLLFLIMCGEEISWGQRYLGLSTPAAIAAINVQEELNFHNLYGYMFDDLFIFCFFAWGVIVPVLDAVAPLCRQVFARLGLPVPSPGLAVSMLAITLMQPGIVDRTVTPLDGLRVAELREALSALAFVLILRESRAVLHRRGAGQGVMAAPDRVPAEVTGPRPGPRQVA